SAFKAAVGLIETTCQHQRAAAEGKRQGVVWRKLIGFVGQLQGQGPVAIRSRTEAVRGPLSPAPCRHGLWQAIAWRQFLRAADLFERGVALLRGNRKRKG